jgi:plasmid maintenance system killer protein
MGRARGRGDRRTRPRKAVTSKTNSDFRRDFGQLPDQIKRQARDAYRLFKSDQRHPSLKFKKLPPFDEIWSIRVNNDYRAIGRWRGDVIVWFFIGSHSDYDKVLARL